MNAVAFSLLDFKNSSIGPHMTNSFRDSWQINLIQKFYNPKQILPLPY